MERESEVVDVVTIDSLLDVRDSIDRRDGLFVDGLLLGKERVEDREVDGLRHVVEDSVVVRDVNQMRGREHRHELAGADALANLVAELQKVGNLRIVGDFVPKDVLLRNPVVSHFEEAGDSVQKREVEGVVLGRVEVGGEVRGASANRVGREHNAEVRVGLDHAAAVIVDDEGAHIVVRLKKAVESDGHMRWHGRRLVDEEDSCGADNLGVAVLVQDLVAVGILFKALGHGLLDHALLEADVVLGRGLVDVHRLLTEEDTAIHVSTAVDLVEGTLEKVFAHVVYALVLAALGGASKPNNVAEVVFEHLGDVVGNLRGVVAVAAFVCGRDALCGGRGARLGLNRGVHVLSDELLDVACAERGAVDKKFAHPAAGTDGVAALDEVEPVCGICNPLDEFRVVHVDDFAYGGVHEVADFSEVVDCGGHCGWSFLNEG